MYNEYFGFKEAPFSIAPDPRYLYMTAQHRDALAHLVYGLNSEGGCILLTGEVGTGKTTICRCLLDQIPDQANVALVLNPKVSEIELLETICDELHISYPDAVNSVKTYTDRIYQQLIESHKKNEKTVLIIDEAQNLDSTVLEQLRLLTNLETNQQKLLQIIILGQPELLDILAKPEMRQLAQRITARFHLQPLSRLEVKAYISHRLAVAGQNIQIFPENSIKLLYKLSDGIPRLINIICDRALLGAYVENQYSVNTGIIKKAANEVFGELKNVEQHQRKKRRIYPLAAISAISILVIAGFIYLVDTDTNPVFLEQPEAVTGTTVNTSSSPGITLQEHEETVAETSMAEGNTALPLTNAVIDDETSTPPTIAKTIVKQAAATSEPGLLTDYTSIEDIIKNKKNDPAAAYQQLFNTWEIEYDKSSLTTACKQATAHSLNCLHKQGNLNSLKLHNRPAVLTLVDSRGNPYHVTITSIENSFADIFYNNTAYSVKLEELDKYWFGQFIILWQKPVYYTSAISPGDSGNIVNWLSKKLNLINNDISDTITRTYNKNLVTKVKQFQEEQGIIADGIVGPITVIHLNTQSGEKSPSLLSLPAEHITKQG